MTDREKMIELWCDQLRATTDFERGYYQGRFEEYARQNAVDPDDFPLIREEARAVYVKGWEVAAQRVEP